MTGLLGPEFAGVKGVVLENVCVIFELVRRLSVERTFAGCPLGRPELRRKVGQYPVVRGMHLVDPGASNDKSTVRDS